MSFRYSRPEELACKNALHNECGGNLLQIESPCQVLRNKEVCETIGPVDNELSKVHKADVHVFSDSVLCLGKQAMNMPEIKFTERWKEHLEQYRESARMIDGDKVQFVFHTSLGRKTNEIVREIDEWIRQGQGEYGHRVTPETCPHRVIFMGMMTEVPISPQGPKEGNAQFLQDAEINAAYFGKFEPGYFMYIGSGSEGTWEFEQYPENPKGRWDELARQVTEVYLVQNIQLWKGAETSQKKRELKWDGANMHFNASEASKKMIMELISSANDICILYGICNYLGKRQTDDLESRQDSTSIVLTPRVSETASLSRASAAGNLSDYLRIAEGHLSARASTGKSDVFATSARAAGNFGLIPKRETTEAVDEESERKKRQRTCSIV